MRDSIMTQEQAHAHWTTMKDAIKRIYALQASTLSYEELYRTAYNLVLHKHGELLYNGVKQITIEMLQPIVQQLIDTPDESLLTTFNDIWTREKLCIIMIKDILMYMDRHYVPKMKLQNVEHLQTSQFKNQVIMNQEIKQKLIRRILSDIRAERDGHSIERSQLRLSISMLVEVGLSSKKVYEQEFEKPFIKETEEYYKAESNQFIVNNSCPAFLAKAKQRLKEEVDRLLSYLDNSTESILLQTFLNEYIDAHALTLLTMANSGLVPLIRHNKKEDLALMYEMFQQVPSAFGTFKKHLTAFFVEEGN